MSTTTYHAACILVKSSTTSDGSEAAGINPNPSIGIPGNATAEMTYVSTVRAVDVDMVQMNISKPRRVGPRSAANAS